MPTAQRAAFRTVALWPRHLEIIAVVSNQQIDAGLIQRPILLQVSEDGFVSKDDLVPIGVVSENYRSVPDFLRVKPAQVMLVAAHNNDLVAAARQGLRTGFVARPTEYGPRQTRDLMAEHEFDVVARDFVQLAALMGA